MLGPVISRPHTICCTTYDNFLSGKRAIPFKKTNYMETLRLLSYWPFLVSYFFNTAGYEICSSQRQRVVENHVQQERSIPESQPHQFSVPVQASSSPSQGSARSCCSRTQRNEGASCSPYHQEVAMVPDNTLLEAFTADLCWAAAAGKQISASHLGQPCVVQILLVQLYGNSEQTPPGIHSSSSTNVD